MSKNVIVTGSGRGIGLGIAERLVSDGWNVIVADIDSNNIQSVLAGSDRSIRYGFQVDVSSEPSVVSLFDAAEAATGPVTAIVCNAGMLVMNGDRPAIVDITLEDWERTHAVNARGTFLCCREFARRRRALPLPNGRIVTVSSVAAELGGYRASSSYISSKSAILGFTKALARELAEDGITANCVAPGVIDAPMFHQSTTSKHQSNHAEEQAKRIPLGRLGLPRDIAGAVSFLLSDSADYITGATIDVNGGYRMA